MLVGVAVSCLAILRIEGCLNSTLLESPMDGGRRRASEALLGQDFLGQLPVRYSSTSDSVWLPNHDYCYCYYY